MTFRFVGFLRSGASRQCLRQKHVRHFHASLSMKADNPYKVLGIPHNATQREIKEAFYALSKRHHPDISTDGKSQSKFQEISNAYEILGDPHKRIDFDRGLVIPKHKTSSADFPSKIDPQIIRKTDSGSFEAQYVRSYNRHLNAAWTERSDEHLSKSAFDYRMDQRNFASVLYIVMFAFILGSYFVAKSQEKPIPFIKHEQS